MATAVEKKTFEKFATEIKETLNRLSGEISQVSTQQATLMGLMNEVKELKEKLVKKEEEMEAKLKVRDLRIDSLEKRLNDLEQYTRKEDVIISGLKTSHRTFAGAVADRHGDESSIEEQLSLECQVIHYFESETSTSIKMELCHAIPCRLKINEGRPTSYCALLTENTKRIY